ncbi:Lipopolysaccharide biosynthesis protein WzxC [Altererythrobacter insulae]|nr:Lipopolysaccharide biosynthesis protein WzxC [Altererythrobacter insulae]
MSLRAGVMKGAASLGGVNLAASILNAVALLVLARLLTPDDFGMVAIATAVLSVVQSSTEMSLNNALIRKDEVDDAHIDTVWTMTLIRSALICFIFVVAAWPLSIAYSSEELIPVLLVSGLTGAIIALQNPKIWLVTKQMSFGPLALSQFLRRALGVIFAVGFALLIGSYWAIILGYLAGAIGVAAISYILIPYRPRFSLLHIKEIWSFSGWVFLSQLFQTLNWRADQLIVGMFVPKMQLGIYAMADNLAVIPARETVHPIRYALFPGLANISGDMARMRQSLLLSQATIALLVAPLGIGLALVAEPVVELALGAQWAETVPFIQLFCLAYTVGILSIGLHPVSMALGETKILFIRQLLCICIKIPAILLGLFTGGLIGAAIGKLVSDVMSAAIEFVLIKRLLDLPIQRQFAVHAFTLIGLSAMAIAVIVLADALSALALPAVAELAMLSTVGASVYCAAIIMGWLALGRPEGSVSVLLDAIKRVVQSPGAKVFSSRNKTEA